MRSCYHGCCLVLSFTTQKCASKCIYAFRQSLTVLIQDIVLIFRNVGSIHSEKSPSHNLKYRTQGDLQVMIECLM